MRFCFYCSHSAVFGLHFVLLPEVFCNTFLAVLLCLSILALSSFDFGIFALTCLLYLAYVCCNIRRGCVPFFSYFFRCAPFMFCLHCIWLHCAMLRDRISAMKPLYSFLVFEEASVACSSDNIAGKLNT